MIEGHHALILAAHSLGVEHQDHRTLQTLFFPTVHIHEGQVHTTAAFDHSLYCRKMEGDAFTLALWTESPGLVKENMKLDPCASLIAGDQYGYQIEVRSRRRNKDKWL